MDLIKVVQDYYEPLNSVAQANKNIDNPWLRKYVTWALFLGSGAFVLTASYALIRSLMFGGSAKINIQLYLGILIIMIVVDIISIFFEGKHIASKLKSIEKPKNSEWISIGISLVVTIVTLYLFWFHLQRYRQGCKSSNLDVVIITVMKLVVWGIVCYRAYEKIREASWD